MTNASKILKFSVSMSVYKNDDPEFFSLALKSILQQSVPPTEIILVVDGPVPKTIEKKIEQFKQSIEEFKIIRLAENKGHAISRQIGIENTKYDLIALMDSDDISIPERFEKQLECFLNDETISVLGGQIYEFIDKPDNIVGVRYVPLDDLSIKCYLKRRCPFNQMTIMMKKSSVLKVGGYLDWYCNEDYYLWIRMYEAGFKFKNLPQNLVNVRVGKEMYNRRGGYKYFKSEARLQKYMWQHRIIGLPQFVFNVSIRWGVQILLPNCIRSLVFRKLFRKSK